MLFITGCVNLAMAVYMHREARDRRSILPMHARINTACESTPAYDSCLLGSENYPVGSWKGSQEDKGGESRPGPQVQVWSPKGEIILDNGTN